MIIIGDESFKTKKEATEKIQNILYKYKSEERLDSEDRLFIEQLIYNHPNCDEKIGSGIRGIEVRQNPVYTKTRNFYILRTDGTSTDFSFVKCITAPSQKAKFFKACRKCIESSQRTFKIAYFAASSGTGNEKICPIIGVPLTFENSHVDHIPPFTFENIVKSFIGVEKINIDEVALMPSSDNAFGNEFASDELKETWTTYHDSLAKLRVVSKTANLSHIRIEANKLKENV